MKKKFDIKLFSNLIPRKSTVNNLAQLLFEKLDHRTEDSEIIMSHIGNKVEIIHLERLRYITAALYLKFDKLGFKRSDTIILASLPGNNELYK